MSMLNTILKLPHHEAIEDPPITRLLLGDVRMAWLWLPLRVWLGWTWLNFGWAKVQNPAWMDGGSALKRFWEQGMVVEPRAVITFDWYRAFIQYLLDVEAYTWFARVVAFGETAVGVALILGTLTGIAAFFGGFMNWNYMMAGTAHVSPLLFVVAVLLILAWKTAGWIGLDRWLLPALGTPWRPGYLRKAQRPPVRPEGLRRVA